MDLLDVTQTELLYFAQPVPSSWKNFPNPATYCASFKNLAHLFQEVLPEDTIAWAPVKLTQPTTIVPPLALFTL